MKTLVFVIGVIACGTALSCSPPYVEPVKFEPAAAYEGEKPPDAPVARVVSINRGRLARRGDNSCVAISAITIAVRDESPRVPYYFEFREVGGAAPDLIFQSGLRAGALSGEGELLFTFYWPETSRKKEEINLRVEITPFTRSGIQGKSEELLVRESEI